MAKPRKRADCHPDQARVTKTGLCGNCHRKQKEQEKRELSDILGQLAQAKIETLTAAEATARAEQILINAIPAAAEAIQRALAVSPTQGPAGNTIGLKAAELLLGQFPTKPKGKTILETQQKTAAALPAGPQVIIGLTLPPAMPLQAPALPAVTVECLPPAQPTPAQPDGA